MGTIKDLITSLITPNKASNTILIEICEWISSPILRRTDCRAWKLSPNNGFSVKSFYKFVIDWGKLCRITPTIFLCFCP